MVQQEVNLASLFAQKPPTTTTIEAFNVKVTFPKDMKKEELAKILNGFAGML